MIVKDKEATIRHAEDISNDVLQVFLKASEQQNSDIEPFDPAEQIYLFIHSLAKINAKIILSLEGYGKIYAIPGLDKPIIRKWLDEIVDEIIVLNAMENSKVLEDIKDGMN
jgi:hypothetical protein